MQDALPVLFSEALLLVRLVVSTLQVSKEVGRGHFGGLMFAFFRQFSCFLSLGSHVSLTEMRI